MANPDRLERVTAQLHDTRNQLSQTRDEHTQLVQQYAQKDVLVNQLRNQLLAAEVRYENKEKELEDYRVQKEEVISTLRNQLLTSETRCENLQREFDDYRSRQDSENPSRPNNEGTQRTPPSTSSSLKQEPIRQNAIASSSLRRVSVSDVRRVNIEHIEISDSDDDELPTRHQNPTPHTPRGPPQHAPAIKRSPSPPPSLFMGKRKEAPSEPDHASEATSKRTRHTNDAPISLKGKEKQIDDPDMQQSRPRRAPITGQSISHPGKSSQAIESDEGAGPRLRPRLSAVGKPPASTSSSGSRTSTKHQDRTAKPTTAEKTHVHRQDQADDTTTKITRVEYLRDYSYDCKGVAFEFEFDVGIQKVCLRPQTEVWVSYNDIEYPVEIVEIRSKQYIAKPGFLLASSKFDVVAIRCRPLMTAPNILNLHPEIDLAKFQIHYGFLGERELVKFNEDHYYCGSAILDKVNFRKCNEYELDIPLLSPVELWTRQYSVRSVQTLVDSLEGKVLLPEGKHCIQKGRCHKTWAPDDEDIRYCTGCEHWYHASCLGDDVNYAHVVQHVAHPQQVHLRNIEDFDPKYPTFEVLARLPIVRRARPPTDVRRVQEDLEGTFYSPLSLERIIAGAIEVTRSKAQNEHRDIWSWCISVQKDKKKYKMKELIHIAVKAALDELQEEDVEVVERLGTTFDVNRWYKCPTCVETAFL